MAGYSKLNRASGPRRALLRGLVTSFLGKGKIKTTEVRAREVQRIAEHLITVARGGGLAARRQVGSYLLDEGVAAEFFAKVAPRYVDRPGGYTRIVALEIRRGDAAPMALLELV